MGRKEMWEKFIPPKSDVAFKELTGDRMDDWIRLFRVTSVSTNLHLVK